MPFLLVQKVVNMLEPTHTCQQTLTHEKTADYLEPKTYMPTTSNVR
jgi:hypothetical protein